jgi:hypothetical protein
MRSSPVIWLAVTPALPGDHGRQSARQAIHRGGDWERLEDLTGERS